jgi:hypothetical protein
VSGKALPHSLHCLVEPTEVSSITFGSVNHYLPCLRYQTLTFNSFSFLSSFASC